MRSYIYEISTLATYRYAKNILRQETVGSIGGIWIFLNDFSALSRKQ